MRTQTTAKRSELVVCEDTDNGMRNIFTTISILPYFYWWYFLIDWFTSDRAKYPNSCGAANTGFIIYHLLIISIYAVAMLLNIALRKQQGRLDYVKFFLIIILPNIFLYLFMILNSVKDSIETNLQEFK